MTRHWKILTVLAVGTIVLVCLWVETLGLGPEKEVAAYKQSLLARGEKLEISEVLPSPVPAAENGADVFNEAVSLVTPEGTQWTNIVPGMRMIGPGKAIICFTQPDVRESYFTNSWSNVIAVVEDNRPASELLAQAASFQALDFHMDYKGGPETLIRYLPSLKRAAQILSTDAICSLHKGDAAPAATNICAIIGLVNADRDDRYLISQLVRMAMTAIAASANWELLQSTNVNDGDLAMLQKSWEQLELVHPMENSLLMERASSEATIRKMRTSDEYLNQEMRFYDPSASAGGGSGDWTDNIHDMWDHMKFGYSKTMWRATWTYSDELRMLQADQTILETIRTIQTNGSFYPAYAAYTNTDTPEDGLMLDMPDIHWMFSEGASALAASLRRTMTAEVTRNTVITAIALKRYQLKYGGYPGSLSKFVPQFLSAVPRDPVDGQPLRYRLNADGTFLLYSVGLNGKDDGGNPTLDASIPNSYFNWLGPHALDWVWPQAATPEETAYFYAHPPK